MTFSLERWRPASLAPASVGRSPTPLLLVAIVVCVAGLGTTFGLAAARAGLEIAARMSGSVTLTPHAGPLESPDAAAARAADILSRRPGVAEARILDPAPPDAALARLIDGGLSSIAEAPRLVSVALKGSQDPRDLIQALHAEGLHAGLDDHGLATGPVERAALIGLAAMGAFKINVLVVLVALSGWAGRRGVAVGADRFELLARLGATDDRLAELVARRVAGRVAIAAVIGALVAAILAVWLAMSCLERLGFTLAVDAWDLCAILPWPPIAALIALLAARRGARAALRSRF